MWASSRVLPARAGAGGARRSERWLNGLVTAEAAARDVFVECPLPHPKLVVRREALAAVGGYRDRGWPEDHDLVRRLWTRAARFRNVERVVLRWREHEARSSRGRDEYELEAFVRAKVSFLLDVDPRKIGTRVYGVPVVSHSEGRALRDALVLGAVGGEGARRQLRVLAREQGRVDGHDFVAVA